MKSIDVDSFLLVVHLCPLPSGAKAQFQWTEVELPD